MSDLIILMSDRDMLYTPNARRQQHSSLVVTYNSVYLPIPCNVMVLLEVVRAGTPESQVHRLQDSHDWIGWRLSIRIGHISPLQEIVVSIYLE
jgi:hypothetical protein